jgi:hypothetical protein
MEDYKLRDLRASQTLGRSWFQEQVNIRTGKKASLGLGFRFLCSVV